MASFRSRQSVDDVGDEEDLFAEEEAQRRRTRNRWALIIVGAGIAVGIVTYILTRRQTAKDQAVIAEQDQQSGSIIGTVGQKFGWSADGASYTFHPTTPPPGIESPPGYSNYYAGNWYEDTPSSVIPDIPDEWKSYEFAAVGLNVPGKYDIYDGSFPDKRFPEKTDPVPPVRFVRGKFVKRCPRLIARESKPDFDAVGADYYWKVHNNEPEDDQCLRWTIWGELVSIHDPFYAGHLNCGDCMRDKKGKCKRLGFSEINGINYDPDTILYEYIPTQDGSRCISTMRTTNFDTGQIAYAMPDPNGAVRGLYWNPNDGNVTKAHVGSHFMDHNQYWRYCPAGTTMVDDGLNKICVLSCPEDTIPALPNFTRCTRLGVDAKSIPIDINTIPGRPTPTNIKS